MSTKVGKINSSVTSWQDRDFDTIELDLVSNGVANNRATNDDLKAIQKAAGANMSVDVNPGVAYLSITKSGNNWRVRFENTATVNVVIAANAGGSNRVDAIIARVDVDVEPDSNAANIGTIERIAGTGTSALSDAAIQAAIGSDAFYRLADVTVVPSASSILTANIADTRAVIEIGRAVGGYKTKFRGDGSALSGIVPDFTDVATVSALDQSQTTRNASVESAEANATTKKNKIGQSFIPAKSKLRSVKLYKDADTGSVTGTVTVALQADTAGSPSGSNLGTRVFTNMEWLSLPVGEFEAIFSSEISGLTPGNLYWIVASASTSDNANHINLGTNSAGGYASGSVKYNNTTDGWVAIATVDLYFKTYEGIDSQIVKTDSLGAIPKALFDPAKMPVPAFSQLIDVTEGAQNTEANEHLLYGSYSVQDGSVLFTYHANSTYRLHRFVRDAITGMYMKSHEGSTASGPTSPVAMMVVGLYLYVFFDGGTNISCYRYLAADLTGEQAMSIPTIAATGNNRAVFGWTDGQFCYIGLEGGSTTVYKLSISGTSMSTVSTGTPDSAVSNNVNATHNDGKNVYVMSISSGVITIVKLNDLFGATYTSLGSTWYFNPYATSTPNDNPQIVVATIDSQRMYIGKGFYIPTLGSGTQVKNVLMLAPVTKP